MNYSMRFTKAMQLKPQIVEVRVSIKPLKDRNKSPKEEITD